MKTEKFFHVAAIMVLAPRIMRGEIDKLPPKLALADSSVGNGAKRTEADLHKLQHNLTGDDGIGIDIVCDFLHGIPGFTRSPVHPLRSNYVRPRRRRRRRA